MIYGMYVSISTLNYGSMGMYIFYMGSLNYRYDVWDVWDVIYLDFAGGTFFFSVLVEKLQHFSYSWA